MPTEDKNHTIYTFPASPTFEIYLQNTRINTKAKFVQTFPMNISMHIFERFWELMDLNKIKKKLFCLVNYLINYEAVRISSLNWNCVAEVNLWSRSKTHILPELQIQETTLS